MQKIRPRFTFIVALCLVLAGCLPDAGQNRQQQKRIDDAMAKQVASNFTLAMQNALKNYAIAAAQEASNQNIGAAAVTNTTESGVRLVSCGDDAHVVAHVVAGQETRLGIKNTTGIAGLRVSSALRKLLPHGSEVGAVTLNMPETEDPDRQQNATNKLTGLTNLSMCREVLANAGAQLGQGPVAVLPFKTLEDTLGNIVPNAQMVRFMPDPNAPANSCQLVKQVCTLQGSNTNNNSYSLSNFGGAQNWVCTNATPPETKDCNAGVASTLNIIQNADITAWENAVAAGIIGTNTMYTINGDVVTPVTKAVAEKLNCPANAEATGIVTNPQVTRTSGWTNPPNRTPIANNAGSSTSCMAGWEGQLFAKYERRSCTLQKLISTAGGVTTDQAVPETVFQLYYVGAKCQTKQPLTNIATCSASVTYSNGNGKFTISRQLAMTQPISLTWSHSKNRSSSTIAQTGDTVTGDYTTLTQTVDKNNLTRSLANALQTAGILQKTTSCAIGTVCDKIEDAPRDYADALCPSGYDSEWGWCKNNNTVPECPTAAPGMAGVWVAEIDGPDNDHDGKPDYTDRKCEMHAVCNGGDPNNGCAMTCPYGDPLPNGHCAVPAVCPDGSPVDQNGVCLVAAVCPDNSAPDANGNCAGAPSNTAGAPRCPTGTIAEKVGDVIVNCTKAPNCRPVGTEPGTLSGHVNFVIDPLLASASIDIVPKICVDANEDRIYDDETERCRALDRRSQQPGCYGVNKCRPLDSNPITISNDLKSVVEALEKHAPEGLTVDVRSAAAYWANNPAEVANINALPQGLVLGFGTSADTTDGQINRNWCSTSGGFSSAISGQMRTYCYVYSSDYAGPGNPSIQNGPSLMADIASNRRLGVEIYFDPMVGPPNAVDNSAFKGALSQDGMAERAKNALSR